MQNYQLSEALKLSEKLYIRDDDTSDNVLIYSEHISWNVYLWYEEEDEGKDWGHAGFWKVSLVPKINAFEQKEYRYINISDFLGDSGTRGFNIINLLEGPWHERK